MNRRLDKKISSSEVKKRVLSKEEKDLWQNVISDVEPLASSDENIDPLQNRVRQIKWKRPNLPFVEDCPKPNEKKLSHGAAPGLDRATQKKIRRGKLNINARIDLHGLSQREAHKALSNFLFNCRSEGLRSVLVITGKGVGGKGVLRESVPKWLNEGNIQQMIRAFSYAAPKDGGEGALYVLLKRIK